MAYIEKFYSSAVFCTGSGNAWTIVYILVYYSLKSNLENREPVQKRLNILEDLKLELVLNSLWKCSDSAFILQCILGILLLASCKWAMRKCHPQGAETDSK